ncbi:MAG: AAA family ATPase [Candidatus Omnitrophica bacterium]|nr:AAA family ATPase [Candidatus Omnitrophota bacterium]
MHLKEIEIFGFKSFPQKTILKMEPGIVVVVGPNGCGKSNVLDAIRWALGEQSPKSLRGTKMEDVIFNGTEKDVPLNYAEVTLTFCNEDKALNIEFSEVSITRRIFRSGESEYYLNKSPVRLKDIQNLLLSVGLGEGSYSFVAQGTIESILTYKPEEKRVIFDEASGILQFKERKREVLRKLDDVDNNLVRLEDIITEVSRQRDSLQRQVQRARRYREIQDDLRQVEKNIAVVKLKELKKEKDLHLEELNELVLKEHSKEELLKENRSQALVKNTELENLRKAAEENNSQIVIANSEISNSQHKIEVNKQRVLEFDSRIDNLKQNTSIYNRRLVEQEARIEGLNKELKSIDVTFEVNKEKVSQHTQAVQVKARQNKEKRQFSKESNETILGLEEERTSFSNNLIDIQSQLNTFLSRKKRLIVEESKSQTEFSDYQQRFLELKGKITSEESGVLSLRDDFQKALEAIKDYEDRINRLSQEKVEKEKEILVLSSQLEFLKDLKVRYDDFPGTQEVTILLEQDIRILPSVIVAKIDQQLEKDSGQNLYRAKTQAKVFSQGIEQLQVKIEQVKVELSRIQDEEQRLKEENLSFREKRRDIEANMHDREKELSRLKEVEASLKENLDRLKEEKELVDFELKETEEELIRFQAKDKELKEALSSKELELKNIQELVAQSEDLIRNNEEDIKNLEIEITRLNTETLSLEEEKKTKHQTLVIFSQDLESIKSSIDNFEKETVDIQSKIDSHQQENKSLEVQIEDKLKSIEDLKLKLKDFRNKEEELIKEHKRFEQEFEDIQKALEEVRSLIYDKKLKMQNFNFDQERVITDLKQLYEVELSLEEIDSWQVEQPLDELLKSEEDCRRKLKYLGQVNLSALDEYEELNQRFEFLDNQRQDLFSSKETLKKAIAKINKTSREMFLETFTKIQEEFRKLFRFLFGGGKAEIYLLDEENLLESGIEIVVQPPEKKLQNVSLLSGGEKSLTAIALIFAIFKIKPSPLCILDEIDAPLDESNVDRFNHLLTEFAKRSQFLVISHNKRTISRADVMYGVTMQESGISKLVSVKFHESKEAAVSS